MKKLTAEEILTIVEEAGYSVYDFAYGEWTEAEMTLSEDEEKECDKAQEAKDEFYKGIEEKYEDWSERRKSPEFMEWSNMPSKYGKKAEIILQKLGLGKVVEVVQYGGEDQGSTWYSVKHFVDHDVYIRTDGHYQSYSGTDFYDGYGKEVRPQQKQITVFE